MQIYSNWTVLNFCHCFVQCRLRMFQNMILQSLFWLRMKHINRKIEESYIITNLIIFILHHMLLDPSHQA